MCFTSTVRLTCSQELDPCDYKHKIMEESANVKFWIKSVFLLLGIGILAPWNAFISAKSYFQKRKCDVPGDPVDESIESVFAMVYNCSSTLSLGLIILAQWLRDQSGQSSAVVAQQQPPDPHSSTTETEATQRNSSATIEEHSSDPTTSSHSFWLVMVPLAVYFFVFSGQAMLVLFRHLPPSTFWNLTLLSLSLCGVCGSIATAGVVATAGLFPSECAMNPFLAGQSVGGVAVAVANFLTAVWEDPTPYQEAHCTNNNNNDSDFQSNHNHNQVAILTSRFLESKKASDESCVVYNVVDGAVFSYFLFGSIILAFCLRGYSFIDQYQRRLHFRSEYESVQSAEVSFTEEESPRIGLEMRRNEDLTIGNLDSVTNYVNETTLPTTIGNHTDLIMDDQVSPGSSVATINELLEDNETTAVWKHIKGPATCIFLVFVVTLGLFPGKLSQLRSAHQCKSTWRLANDLYTPLAFVVFNVSDLGGRLLSARIPYRRFHHLSRKLVLGACLRFLFFPLFSLCSGMKSDFVSWLVQICFAMSNGLLVNLSFVHAPELIPAIPHVQERSSEILTFSVAFGLLTGSILSYQVVS